MAFNMWINRVYAHSASMIGVLYAGDKQLCFTLELPWRDNMEDISCIPVGSYTGKIRTDGPKGWRIELAFVPNRTLVQLHVGTKPDNSIGCILLGVHWLENQLKDAGVARDQLKNAYEAAGSPSDITLRITGYP